MNSSQQQMSARKGFQLRKKDEAVKLAALRIREVDPSSTLVDRNCVTCAKRFTFSVEEVRNVPSLYHAKMCFTCKSTREALPTLFFKPFAGNEALKRMRNMMPRRQQAPNQRKI